jgi:NAD(P)-dependent dehydrogenase (short-subunit alcohol dehydrogenase family)
VNARGTFFLLQAAARHFLSRQTRGVIVNIASVAGRSGRPLQSPYAASKAAVISITRSAALALASHGIRVNAVCPGVIDTEMTRQLHREKSAISGLTPEESLAEMVRSIPLGGVGTALDVANMVLFLASDHAAYVTGQALNVCGGLEMD